MLIKRPTLSFRRFIAIAVLVIAATTPLWAGTNAEASTISTLKSKASAIATRIDTLQVKLNILSEEYDQAKTHVQELNGQIAKDKTASHAAESSVAVAAVNLRHQAVNAYVSAVSSAGLSSVLDENPNALPSQQTYLQAASGSLTTSITSLHDAEHHLSVRRATLDDIESQAIQAENTIAQSQQNAISLEGQLESTLRSVNGSLSTAVAAEEAAAQQQAAAAHAAAPVATSAAALASPPQAPPVTTSTGSGAGARAVSAAESQIGVPYVWGGATPGVGFDCSGLAMWAWGQAGVDLPHSAAAQYADIEHISLSELEPGDLVFYADGGYVYHVVIYIGGGRVVQAEETGTTITITPLWPGAYGAGRP